MFQINIIGLDNLTQSHSDDDVTAAVEQVAHEFALNIAERTTLTSKLGSFHWHLRKPTEPRGVLEVTYWPKRLQLQIEIHQNRKQAWNVGVSIPFAEAVAKQLGLTTMPPTDE
jgi:hypothetical protein